MIHRVFIKLSKNENMLFFLVALLSLLIAFVLSLFDFWKKITEIGKYDFSIIYAILLECFLWFVVKGVCWYIARKEDERAKLTTDYDSIISIYDEDSQKLFMSVSNKNEVDIRFPIVKVESLWDREITICDNKESHYGLPANVMEHYDELIKAHRGSSVYNSNLIRVKRWGLQDNTFVMQTERTTFYDSLVTNRAMDHVLKNGLTIRSLFECGPSFVPFDQSVLSNHLGFNGFIETKDHFILLVRRKKSLSIGKCKWGDSFSATVKTGYALEGGIFSLDGLYRSILNEIKDEIGLEKEELCGERSSEKVKFITAYRDYLEGGKPQLCVYVKTTLNKKMLTKVIKGNNKIQHNHFTGTSYKPKAKTLTRTDMDWYDFVYVGDIKYRSKIYNNRIEVYDKVYPMLPSYSACIQMLKEYLLNT